VTAYYPSSGRYFYVVAGANGPVSDNYYIGIVVFAIDKEGRVREILRGGDVYGSRPFSSRDVAHELRFTLSRQFRHPMEVYRAFVPQTVLRQAAAII